MEEEEEDANAAEDSDSKREKKWWNFQSGTREPIRGHHSPAIRPLEVITIFTHAAHSLGKKERRNEGGNKKRGLLRLFQTHRCARQVASQ